MSRLTLAIALIVIAIGLALIVIRPQWAGIIEARQAIRQLQALDVELTSISESRDALMAEYNSIPEASFEKLKGMAPADRKTTPVLADLEELARRNAMALDQVEFVAGERSTLTLGSPGARRYGTTPVTLSLRGKYENFREFLIALEHNLRLVDVDEITMTSSGPDKESPITLKGTLYYQR